MWKLMRQIKLCHYAPWLMIGDFNEVMWSFEHFLSQRRPPKQMLEFTEVLSYCNLHDLSFSGLPWTYDNKRTYDNKQARERNVRDILDRVVASPSWSAWFPDAKLQHLVSFRSDHCPFFLSLEQDNEPRQAKRIIRCKINKVWEAGAQVQNLGDVALTLHIVMKSLRSWSFEKFGAIMKELENIKGKIEELSIKNHVAN
jgi:hypothetical protein